MSTLVEQLEALQVECLKDPIASRLIQLQDAGEERAAVEWNEVAKDFLKAIEGAQHG